MLLLDNYYAIFNLYFSVEYHILGKKVFKKYNAGHNYKYIYIIFIKYIKLKINNIITNINFNLYICFDSDNLILYI